MGNGKDISIWSDAWLPSISTPRVSNPMGIDFPEVRVNSLINAQTRNWDVDLLQALFKPEEVQLIRGISLGDVSTRDRMIWPHTQSGTYTVKSRYNLLSKEKEIWTLSILILPHHRNFGRQFGVSQYHQKSETFCGGLQKMPSLLNPTYSNGRCFRKKFVITVRHIQRTWFMPCGCAPV